MVYTKEFFRKRLTAQLHATPGTNGTPADAELLIRLPDDRQFVAAAYRGYLGREPDLAGMMHHLESLQNHVPRRVVLARIADSDEARARSGGTSRPVAATPRQDGLLTRLKRHVHVRVRDLARQLILSRFDSIDYKLSFLLEEMAARTDAVSKKADHALEVLAAKSDAYFAETWTRQQEADQAFEQRIARLEQRLGAVEASIHPPAVHAAGVIATEVHGFIVGVPAAEWRMAAYHSFRGPLEPGLTRLFEKTVRPGMIVVDAGANVGFYTLLAARLLEGSGRVWAFEPAPATFAILRDNVQVNGFLESGVAELRQQAVSDRSGAADLFVFADNSGHNTLYRPQDGIPSVSVPMVTLDEALAAEPRVDFVKIDTEGAEPAVLAGMRRIVDTNPDIRIAIEFAPGHLQRAGRNPGEFLRQLRQTFAIERIDDLTAELSAAADSDLTACFSANLLLRRSGGAH